jgi:chromosome segregation ATPase
MKTIDTEYEERKDQPSRDFDAAVEKLVCKTLDAVASAAQSRMKNVTEIDDAIDAIEQLKIEMVRLQNSVEETSTATTNLENELDTEIAKNQSHDTTVESNFNTIQGQLLSTNTAISALQSKVQELEQTIISLETRLQILEAPPED